MLSTEINTRGLGKKLRLLPRKLKREVPLAMATYLVGNSKRGLKHEPRYKTVSRKRAYGKTFFTDKQRRYFFWAKKQGIIKPGRNNRTHEMSKGWRVVPVKSGARVVNSVPHAKWSHSNTEQARLNALVGWRRVRDIEESNRKGMVAEGNRKAKELISEL